MIVPITSWQLGRILIECKCGSFFLWGEAGLKSSCNAQYWIEKLNLTKHPEGGFFAPAFRASEQISRDGLPDRFAGNRAIVSSIYYLLEKGQFSTFHRLKSVEIWNFFEGDPLMIHILDPHGALIQKMLGRNFDKGESFQAAIEPGSWFAAEHQGRGEFTLVGCTVAPGFEYEDMEIASRAELQARYPQHLEIIEKLTRVQ
ncbi:MAG: cupin domain-containing protein [Syntrophobacteraceae bacterium]|jgi:predicted cupin superfamily sugar epimerase